MHIDEFDALPEQEAAAALSVAAAIDTWVAALLAGRPYGDAEALLAAAATAARAWTPAEIDAALADHPRIGERPAAAPATSTGASAAAGHSEREQAGVDPADGALAERLRAGNLAYEARFDRIYLVRAKGRDGTELARLLEGRLSNDPATELSVVHEQLAQIALLRLADLVDVSLDPTGFDAAPVLAQATGTGTGTGTDEATLSTHVLDAERGRPAAGMPLTVHLADGTVRSGATDADGRLRLDGAVPAGASAITFDTGTWFATANRRTFYPQIRVDFDIAAAEHHHVALLLSPYSYTTYRGS